MPDAIGIDEQIDDDLYTIRSTFSQEHSMGARVEAIQCWKNVRDHIREQRQRIEELEQLATDLWLALNDTGAMARSAWMFSDEMFDELAEIKRAHAANLAYKELVLNRRAALEGKSE